MMKTALALIAFALIAGSAPSSAASADAEFESAGQCVEMTPIDNEECCKLCTKGKACGASCIARDRKCHQPPGCACDA